MKLPKLNIKLQCPITGLVWQAPHTSKTALPIVHPAFMLTTTELISVTKPLLRKQSIDGAGQDDIKLLCVALLYSLGLLSFDNPINWSNYAPTSAYQSIDRIVKLAEFCTDSTRYITASNIGCYFPLLVVSAESGNQSLYGLPAYLDTCNACIAEYFSDYHSHAQQAAEAKKLAHMARLASDRKRPKRFISALAYHIVSCLSGKGLQSVLVFEGGIKCTLRAYYESIIAYCGVAKDLSTRPTYPIDKQDILDLQDIIIEQLDFDDTYVYTCYHLLQDLLTSCDYQEIKLYVTDKHNISEQTAAQNYAAINQVATQQAGKQPERKDYFSYVEYFNAMAKWNATKQAAIKAIQSASTASTTTLDLE